MGASKVILGRRSSRPRRAASALVAACGAVALLSLLGSCSNSTRLPAPFYFNTPGDVDLACFNGDHGDGDDVVLPFDCCASGTACGGTQPIRHALVTQTARGEVAAIDLEHAKVLDSQRRVPGFTFVDVGALPAAIVVPRHLPGSLEHGPQWTYVAGRQANSIRAVATCKFLLGKACGPEENLDDSAREEQMDLQLPEAPQDMLLDPGGEALWVSLPKAGLIARIDLGKLGPDGDPLHTLPFATEAGSLTPRPPTYFVVPSGITSQPELPTPESSSYQAVCGLGYAYKPAEPALPVHPRQPSSGQALPTRMRLLPGQPHVDPMTLPVLLVADIGQSVVHAFAIVDGELQQRAAMPVGAPLRDFVITPPVPSQAPSFEQLVDPETFAYAEPPANDKRYVYAIDARDGSVMVFDLSFSGEVPALAPLDAPVPPRADVDVTRSARDRLMFQGGPARSLEVFDTRYRAQEDWENGTIADGSKLMSAYRDSLYCGLFTLEELKEQLADAKEHASKSDIDALQAAITWTEAAEQPDVLRGVFVLVAASDGRLSVIDVHDLNLQCRARAACSPGKDPEPPAEGYDDSALAVRRHAPRLLNVPDVSVLLTSRRDLATLTGEPSPDGGVPDEDAGADAEAPDEDDADAGSDGEDAGTEVVEPCPDGYYRPEEDSPICVISDPWQARNLTWSAIYEGALTPVTSALLRDPDPEGVTLVAPQGLDFCARGANAADDLTVVITSQPDPDVSGCQAPTHGHEPLLYVVEAYQDHLVLARTLPESADAGDEMPEPEEMDGGMGEPEDGGEPGDGGPDADAQQAEAGEPEREIVKIDELMKCYPEFVNAELRLRDQFLVTYSNGAPSHANRADDGGVCVADPEIDRRFSSRVSAPDWIFQDLAVGFQLSVPTNADREDIAPTVQLSNQSVPLAPLNVDSSSGRVDALPSRVRFFSDTNDLFVVDGASQGLRRYLFEPFEADTTRYR